MPFCDVVSESDSTDLWTDRPNLRPITVVGDRYEPIQMPSNVSWINISTHTTVDVDQKNTKPRTSSWLKSALSMPTNSLCIQMFQRKAKYTVHSEFRTALATGLIQTSQKAVSEAKKNVNWISNWKSNDTFRKSSNLQKKEPGGPSWVQGDRLDSQA